MFEEQINERSNKTMHGVNTLECMYGEQRHSEPLKSMAWHCKC